jgi:hypothetical protein
LKNWMNGYAGNYDAIYGDNGRIVKPEAET